MEGRICLTLEGRYHHLDFKNGRSPLPTLIPCKEGPIWTDTVVPGFSVLGFRALPGFRALCTGNQIYVINLPGFSALPGFKAPFHGDG